MFETCYSKTIELVTCKEADCDKQIDLVKMNKDPHLLSHKESQPTDAMFKQQRFLGLIKRENVRMKRSFWAISKHLTSCARIRCRPLTEWSLGTWMPGHRHQCRCLSLSPHSGYGWVHPGHSGWQNKSTFNLKIHIHTGQWLVCDNQNNKSVLVTLLSSSPYRTGLPPSGKVGLGGGESEKQLITSAMFL